MVNDSSIERDAFLLMDLFSFNAMFAFADASC